MTDSDFNDLHRLSGIDEVKRQLESNPYKPSSNHVPEGGRNGYLATLGNTMSRHGCDRSTIEVALLAENVSKCLPQLTEQDVKNIVAGIGSYDSGWRKPEQIPNALRSVPDLDLKLLPESIQDWVADIAYRQGCPVEFPVVTALVMMGAVPGTKIAVCPKRNDTEWRVVPNQWGAIIGSPSTMKSPAMHEARKPLLKVAAKMVEDADKDQEPLRQEYATKKREYEIEKRAVESLMLEHKKGKATDKTPSLSSVEERSKALHGTLNDLEELHKRAYREVRLETSDATIEALSEIQEANPNGILVYRDELTGWLDALLKPGRESDRPYYLEGWAGTNSFVSDRIGRGSTYVENHCLSIFGSIQPGPLSEMVEATLSGKRCDDGLLQRFQTIVWRTHSKDQPKDISPDRDAYETAEAAFIRLYEITPDEAGCEPDEKFPYLRFDQEAFAHFWAWNLGLRTRAETYPDDLASHLIKYSSLAPSFALICHLADGGTGEIPLTAAQKGVGLCEWLWEHAQRIYTSGKYSGNAPLIRLCQHILIGDLDDEFTLRDLKRKGWSGIGSDNAQALLNELEDMNWLRQTNVVGGKGGRASIVCTVNPLCKSMDFSSHIPKPTATTDETSTNWGNADSYGSYDSNLSGRS